MTEPLLLPLDHVSLRASSLDAVLPLLEVRLGLPATRTAQAPHQHSRVFLDRSYLEVAAPREGAGAATEVQAEWFFLRYDDEAHVQQHLQRRGLPPGKVERYVGKDGVWMDFQVPHPEAARLLLVRRTEPAEVARDWPPRKSPTDSALTGVAAVVLSTPELTAAANFFSALVGLGEPPAARRDELLGAPRVDIPLSSGRIILVERAQRGVEGLLLGSVELPRTRRFAEDRGVTFRSSGPELWVEAGLPGPLRWGLVSAPHP